MQNLSITEISRGTPMEELVRAGALLSRELNFKPLIQILVEQAQDISHSDLAAFYIFKDMENWKSDLKLVYQRGKYDLPPVFSEESEIIPFIRDCREAVVLLDPVLSNGRAHPFRDLLIHPAMQSGMALPIQTPKREIGILLVNSRLPRFYNRSRFYFLDSFSKLAGGILESSRLFKEMQEYLRKIEAMERYQESIFSSMTNLIITTDEDGKIHYFNRTAAESLELNEEHLGMNLDSVFNKSLNKKTLAAIQAAFTKGEELLGIEGIYKAFDREIDYSLNVSPLKTPRGKKEGLTLLFTDQTRERQLKEKVEVAVEERRVIKDMFSRYMSTEMVTNILESPEAFRPGGDKKNATVFFADIRGYTSFSEGKEPEYIIEILNEYFGEAVEFVLSHRGYIDKFIGDCIMAVWGVPLVTEEQDAVNAVSCALSIQELVRSSNRKFFQNGAKGLKVGIGINSGPLVAGNLGSAQRMDYSVIGDTVNLAARLEGVAGADEIIITQTTRDYLGDQFILEKRPDVKVKGKIKPIEIYNVVKRAG